MNKECILYNLNLFSYFLFRKTKHKQCICQVQFSSEYPKTPMLFELKSKVFSDKVLKTISQLVEAELKKLVDRVQVGIKE